MIFFFSSRRRHTRLQGDWSSDVCSSDLDQSTYVNLWRGTAVQTEVNYLLNFKGVPVGGTSAGLAVLSQFIYTGELGSVTSSWNGNGGVAYRLNVEAGALTSTQAGGSIY